MYRTINEFLARWKHQTSRTPLIVRGARQVGKSHAITAFGREHFGNLCIANLELHQPLARCFASRNADEICRQLEVILDQPIIDGETLLFIDEIQNSPDALVSLRAFKENRPELQVIAAGSLLEFALQDQITFSFPVGRVAFAHLNPLSFAEFLLALGHEKLLTTLSKCSLKKPCSEVIHEHLLKLVQTYFFIGGMPEVVEVYRRTQSLREARAVQNRLNQAFAADFAKYGRRYDHRRLQNMLASVPRLVGSRFKYSHVDPDSKARDLKQPLLDLEKAGLVRLVRASHALGVPIASDEREGIFKVQLLDIGLMLNTLGIDSVEALSENILFANEGALAEQFVGQELLALTPPDATPQLHFWARDRAGAEAEVDFVLPIDGKIIPIEVKAGKTGTLRSLRLFMKERNIPLGVRISQHPLSLVDGVLSVPFYFMHELPRFVKEGWG